MLSLYRPDMLPQTVAPDEDAAKFAAAAREYRNTPQPVEPYFRDEPVSELGFSFQNWVRYCCSNPLPASLFTIICHILVPSRPVEPPLDGTPFSNPDPFFSPTLCLTHSFGHPAPVREVRVLTYLMLLVIWERKIGPHNQRPQNASPRSF